MRIIRTILLALTVMLGFGLSVQTVDAVSLGGYNVGDYVYEDDEVITNEQVEQLDQINQKTDQGENPQELYLVLIGSNDTWKTFSDSFSNPNAAEIPESKGIPGLIIGNTGQAVIGRDKYYDLEMNHEADMDNTNNYIVFNFNTNRFYFNPSDQAGFYLTDLMVWKLMWGLNSQLKSGNSDEQMAAIMQFAKKVQPKLEDVSQTNKLLHSATYGDVSDRVKWVLAIIGIIIAIIVIVAWKKSHPGHRGGGGSELGNSDYDAGFDEGYYMGSNDPFM